MPNLIHPTAILSARAALGRRNVIGPYAVIEDDVVIGDGNWIGAHSVIKNGARIGNSNRIHEHVVFAGPPQDIDFQDAPTTAELGDGNVLREFVTVSRATSKEEGRTTIGDSNYFMACTHVAHDCRLGSHIIMANDAVLAGHVHIEDRVFISGGVKIHQFARIGAYAMIGGNSKITQDCLPYMITDGIPGRVCGLNLVGLKRAGFGAEGLRDLKAAYQILFGARGALDRQLAGLERLGTPTAMHLLGFIRSSKRSFHRA